MSVNKMAGDPKQGSDIKQFNEHPLQSASQMAGSNKQQANNVKSENDLTTMGELEVGERNRATQSQDDLDVDKENVADLFDKSTAANSNHHVGPVMGIFFKVWSLVKVTRGRNNHKIRRQNSEDTNQFQYISGEQFQQQQQLGGGKRQTIGQNHSYLIQDRHFRRAGSQPVQSNSMETAGGNRLVIMSNGLPLRTGTSSTGTSTGSSSSAYSKAELIKSQFCDGKRNNSAHRIERKSLAEQQQTDSKQQNQVNWVSKIRRSATAGSQSAAVESLEKSNSRPNKLKQTTKRKDLILSLQQQELRLNETSSSSLMNSSKSYTDNLIDSDDKNNDDGDDGDSYDIYSTPNDSIQSVPGTAPVISQSIESMNATNQYNPIVKSFSSNNFNQLIKQQLVQTNKVRHNIQPIEEIRLHEPHGQRPGMNRENSNNKSSDSSSNKSMFASTANMSRGSRFFISSSSSEDSSSPANQKPGDNSTEPSASQQLQQQTTIQVPIKQGVHYHSPVSQFARPDSLFLNGQQFAPILLPTTNGNLIAAMSPVEPSIMPSSRLMVHQNSYKKSPSLFEIAASQQARAKAGLNLNSKFNSKYPSSHLANNLIMSSFKLPIGNNQPQSVISNNTQRHIPNSFSLYDYKNIDDQSPPNEPYQDQTTSSDDYKLTQMLLEFGSNKNVKDLSTGNTALMQSILSDNLSAIKCLIFEHKVDLNELNDLQLSALDLLCSKQASQMRLEMLQLLVDNGGNIDSIRESDKTRLLDRLIGQHAPPSSDKLPFIDCLLLNGAKLSSSTWLAAMNKYDVQLRLLNKLIHDGYFLYKKLSIEEAVYRFEYALKRLAELEQQLFMNNRNFNLQASIQNRNQADQLTLMAARQIKFQIYLGLSRCERKRKFFKRALEFAHLTILVDSTSYEGFYSKANILKDIGEIDDALLVIEQTFRLVDKSIESIEFELDDLYRRRDSMILFSSAESQLQQMNYIESSKSELISNLNYLNEAKKYVSKLKEEIVADKMSANNDGRIQGDEKKADNGTFSDGSTALTSIKGNHNNLTIAIES